jgi:hypothetical protein
VYRDINDLGKFHLLSYFVVSQTNLGYFCVSDSYVEWRMTNCSAVPQNWNSGVFWIDIHGKCLQFYEGAYCSRRSLQLQSTQESSIFKWNFPSYNIKSVNLCKQSTSGGESSNRPIGSGSGGGGGGSSNGNGPVTGGSGSNLGT